MLNQIKERKTERTKERGLKRGSMLASGYDRICMNALPWWTIRFVIICNSERSFIEFWQQKSLNNVTAATNAFPSASLPVEMLSTFFIFLCLHLVWETLKVCYGMLWTFLSSWHCEFVKTHLGWACWDYVQRWQRQRPWGKMCERENKIDHCLHQQHLTER